MLRWRMCVCADGVVAVSFSPKITRGKTTLGRLRLVDAFMVSEHSEAVKSGPFVDLGCGVGGLTTIESRDALNEAAMNPIIWAIDADETRLPCVDGIQTSTELCVDQIGVLRAMNVLRQYKPEQAQQAIVEWQARLSEGGVLIEGTSDKRGDIATFFCLGQRDELVMMTTFARGFGPWMLRDYLPQIWRRRVKPGTQFFDFFEAWAAEFQAQSSCTDPQTRFLTSLSALEFDGLGAGVVAGGAYVRLPVCQSSEGIFGLAL